MENTETLSTTDVKKILENIVTNISTDPKKLSREQLEHYIGIVRAMLTNLITEL